MINNFLYRISTLVLSSMFIISCQKEAQKPANSNEEFSTAAQMIF
jgi:hypothetical protein